MHKTLVALALVSSSWGVAGAQAVSDAGQAPPEQPRAATPASPQPTTAAPTTSANPAVAVPAVAPASGTAFGKIVMYRGSSIVGAGIACPIRYQGKEMVELSRGKYAEWVVNPGRYVLTNKTGSVEVSVGPGETQYVRCMIKPGFLVGRADLQIADEASFDEHSKEFEKKPIE